MPFARPLTLSLLALALVGCTGASSAPSQTTDSAVGDALPVDPSDSIGRQALAALEAGRPWRATRLLAPVVRDSARRTPEAVLLAAAAAARWGGWRQVDSLLARAPWTDSLFGGQARALLAHAALERGADTLALAHALAAVARAPDERARGERLVLLARALDRMDQRDSARASYARAAAALPAAADWLRLRAAGVTADSAARAGYYAAVTTGVARARVPWTEALARERTGDPAGAARAYAALGAPAATLRLRLALARARPEPARASALDSVRRDLLALVAQRAGTPDARTAVELLDQAFAPLPPADELLAARSAARSGPLARAAAGFERARAGGLSAEDRFAYGAVLIRLDRNRDAAAQFAQVTAPAPLAAAAGYQRGRALVRAGDLADARQALRQVLARHPRDTSAAAALVLLADLAADEGRDADARAAYLEAARLADSPRAPLALFRAALIAYAGGNPRQAAAEWDTLARRFARSEEARAAVYWAGRAWAALGDSARARERWRACAAPAGAAAGVCPPLSYYAMTSSRRLGVPPWAPPGDTAAAVRGPAGATGAGALRTLDSALARVALLESLGMGFEVGLEHDRLAREAQDAAPSAASSPEARARLFATAEALARRGLGSRAIALGWRALETPGVPRDARTYRLVYPITHGDVIAAEAGRAGIDPALVAALIRQESNFNPRATSPAGARGLMQVMPSVGAAVARSLGIPAWDPVLLYESEVSIALGVRHLDAFMSRYEHLAYALAAYNAGQSRVTRWSARTGTADPEVFVERIPFAETRDYVRIVLRNLELYRALYAW